MKALEDMDDDEPETEAVSSVLNTVVEQAAADEDDDDDDDDDEQNTDETGLAARIAKRSIASATNVENDAHQMKRLRSNPAAAAVSV
jgi:hypothetical protein